MAVVCDDVVIPCYVFTCISELAVVIHIFIWSSRMSSCSLVLHTSICIYFWMNFCYTLMTVHIFACNYGCAFVYTSACISGLSYFIFIHIYIFFWMSYNCYIGHIYGWALLNYLYFWMRSLAEKRVDSDWMLSIGLVIQA